MDNIGKSISNVNRKGQLGKTLLAATKGDTTEPGHKTNRFRGTGRGYEEKKKKKKKEEEEEEESKGGGGEAAAATTPTKFLVTTHQA